MQEDHARRRWLETAALAVPCVIRGRCSLSSCCTIGWARDTKLTPAQAAQHIIWCAHGFALVQPLMCKLEGEQTPTEHCQDAQTCMLTHDQGTRAPQRMVRAIVGGSGGGSFGEVAEAHAILAVWNCALCALCQACHTCQASGCQDPIAKAGCRCPAALPTANEAKEQPGTVSCNGAQDSQAGFLMASLHTHASALLVVCVMDNGLSEPIEAHSTELLRRVRIQASCNSPSPIP